MRWPASLAIGALLSGCTSTPLEGALSDAGLRPMTDSEYALLAGKVPAKPAERSRDPVTGEPSRRFWPAYWCAGATDSDFEVSLDGGAVAINSRAYRKSERVVPEELRALIAPVIERSDVTFLSFDTLSDFVEFDRGFAAAFYGGEFGGMLAWFGRDGSFEDHRVGATSDLLFDGDRLWAAYGLDHLGLGSGGLAYLPFEEVDEGSPFGIAARELSKLPTQKANYHVLKLSGGIVGVTGSSLTTFEADGRLSYLAEPITRPIQDPNSAIAIDDGTVVVGAAFGVGVWKDPFKDLQPELFVPVECEVAVPMPGGLF